MCVVSRAVDHEGKNDACENFEKEKPENGFAYRFTHNVSLFGWALNLHVLDARIKKYGILYINLPWKSINGLPQKVGFV